MNILIVGNGRAGSRWGRLARKLDHVVSFYDVQPSLTEFNFDPLDVRAIIIATPAEKHFESARLCQQFWPRVPMLVEKPLDVSLDHQDEWRQIKPSYVAQWRCHKAYLDWFGSFLLPADESRFHYCNPAAVGDPLMETAIHDIDLVRHTTGADVELAGIDPGNYGRRIAVLLRPTEKHLRTSYVVVADHETGSRRIRYFRNGDDNAFADDDSDHDAAYMAYLKLFLAGDNETVAGVEDGLAALAIALQAKEMLADA